MKNYLSLILFFYLSHLHLFADTYVWEDYDEFSGSSLDTSKWDIGYFEGGQPAIVSGGKAQLIGTGFTGSNAELTPAPWVGALANSVGQSNSGIFLKSENVYGLEVEVTIPTSGNSKNVGFIIETYSEGLSSNNGIELAWREDGLYWSFENENPSSGQLYEIDRAANLDETYKVAVIHTGSRMELHINGERVANLNSTFSPAHWLVGSFNDDGNLFSVSIDNVHILRQSSETLNGSGLFLDSDDPVSLTLQFENNLITSTFDDNGGSDSGTESGIPYDYIIYDESNFSITFTDAIVGDYITFDRSINRGKLYDFKDDGQIDTSGTWEFTFESIITPTHSFAPSSLVGKTIHIPEDTSNEANYFFMEDEVYYVVPDSNLGLVGISYTYVANTSTTATLTLARNEPGDVIHQISFSSPTSADSNWTDVESNVTGSASLEILTEGYWPSTLAGWSYKGSSINDTFYFVDEGHAVFYDASDSNFSNRELSNITYTWEQIGPRIGKLTTNLGEETLLFFESNTSGFFDWEETGSDGGNSGQFDLYYYSVGKALESLVGSSITMGDTTYVFTSLSTVTVHGPSGTSSQEYSYLRENEDEALLSVGSSLYKLDFYNHQYGRIIEGGSGYFAIHQNWATKGWVWQDHYPWAYSNNMQDWFYQVLFINDDNESDMAHYQVWDNQWSIPSELHYFGESNFSSADAYSWEVYDDFNGTELNSSKWGTMYLGGGIEPYVSGGKLVLSAGSGNSSSVKVVKAGWEDIFQNDDGGQAWVYPMDNEIMGIEAEFVIPGSVNSMSGLALGVASLSPLTYATAELNADPNSASQYSQGFGFYHLENNGSEVENFATTLRDTTHRLGATFIEGKIKLYVDGEIRYEGVAGTFNTDMFFLNGFNDYQGQGLAFELTVDNVRVLRKKSYPQGWMWMDYYPWAYSYESNSWLYFQLAKDMDGQPG
ncbi:LamG domain-containing protein, partial [Opitutales bacterium]|nr:LamG domain-containing protein [Opitutales bacterium]